MEHLFLETTKSWQMIFDERERERETPPSNSAAPSGARCEVQSSDTPGPNSAILYDHFNILKGWINGFPR